MDEKKELKASKSVYAIALEIGGTATAWIVIPAVAAVYGGQWLDQRFNTKPTIFVVAMALAFIVTLVGILRMAREYLKQESKDSK